MAESEFFFLDVHEGNVMFKAGAEIIYNGPIVREWTDSRGVFFGLESYLSTHKGWMTFSDLVLQKLQVPDGWPTRPFEVFIPSPDEQNPGGES